MKKLSIIAGILFTANHGFSQNSIKVEPPIRNLSHYIWSFSRNNSMPREKPLIDFNAIDNWRGLGSYLAVSDNGNYFAYTINKMVYNDFAYGLLKIDTLVIQSTTNAQRSVFPGAKSGSFTADSREYIFQDGSNLCFFQLGTRQLKEIRDVASYQFKQNKWLAYQLKGKDSLSLRNLITGKQKQFPGITDYNFSNNGEWLIYQKKDNELHTYSLAAEVDRKFTCVEEYLISENERAGVAKATDGENAVLQYLDLSRCDTKTIWRKKKTKLAKYCMDALGKQVAFVVVDSANVENTGVWFYASGTDKPVLKLNTQTTSIPGAVAVGGLSFTKNGRYLKVSLQSTQEARGKPNVDLADVEVWNHKDLNFQSAQQKLLTQAKVYNAIIDVESGLLKFVETDNKKLVQIGGDFALIKKDYSDEIGDRFWDPESFKDSAWLLSLKDGSTRLLKARKDNNNIFWFSPDGSWFVYFDASNGCHYHSYNLRTGELKNISATVADNQLGITDNAMGSSGENLRKGNLAAWIINDKNLLVYDTYDIWKLDLTGKETAENITNGFGRANKTVLNLFATDHYSGEVPTISRNEPLILRAFDTRDKQSGFYKKENLAIGTPTELYMGKYFMNLIPGCHDLNLSNAGMAPLKAIGSNVWIVQRQSAIDAPNYFSTTDYRKFTRLTNFKPQEKYKWLTQELHSFKHLDGDVGQGILYKPEDFDSTKKYPVVIAFYGGFSNNLYQFRDPTYLFQSMAAGMSPIWFLNNGFLVFTPDIAVAPLKYGPKAYSCIEGAAKFLKQLSYVDADKLAYASHSWSSQLGAYLFTHSTTFNAAAITEGYSYGNMISQAMYMKNGVSHLSGVEEGRRAGNLWENRDTWLDQTTVLNVDKSKASLLLLCNKESSDDYKDQAVQLFTAMRRLNKNVWWLKYDNGSHTLSNQNELKDYTIRYTQFLDHYLKNAPPPQWMTQGVPYKLKGIESRYELDPQGACTDDNGEACLICNAWNAQYAKTPSMFHKDVKDWILDKDIAEELARKQKERRNQLDQEGEKRTKEVLKILAK